MTLFSSIARTARRIVAPSLTLITATALIAPRMAAAQSTQSVLPTSTDSTAQVSTTPRRFHHQNVWLSGGVGGGGTMAESVSNGEQSGTRTYFPAEHSFATSIEAALTYKAVGVGIDAFTARSHRMAYRGLALSIQLGYLE